MENGRLLVYHAREKATSQRTLQA